MQGTVSYVCKQFRLWCNQRKQIPSGTLFKLFEKLVGIPINDYIDDQNGWSVGSEGWIANAEMDTAAALLSEMELLAHFQIGPKTTEGVRDVFTF